MQRQVSAFNTTLGLRAAGADKLNVEVVKYATKLRDAGAPGFCLADAEYSVFIAVKCHRLAVFTEVLTRGQHVVEGGLRFTKT